MDRAMGGQQAPYGYAQEAPRHQSQRRKERRPEQAVSAHSHDITEGPTAQEQRGG